MKKLLYALFALALCVSGASCAKQAQTEDAGYSAETVHIAYNLSAPSFVAVMIKEQNLLDKYLPENVSVEWARMDSAADIRDALVGGKIDIALSNYTTFAIAADKKLPLTLVSNGYNILADVFTNDPQYRTIDDFNQNDKILIASLGSTYEFAMKLVCKETFGNADYFDGAFVVSAEDTMIQQLLSADTFKGAVIKFPFTAQAEKTENLYRVLSLGPLMAENGLNGCHVANSDYQAKNPAIIEAFIKAQNDAVAFINSHVSETAQVLGQLSQVDSGAIAPILTEYPAVTEISESAYNNTVQFLHENGLLDHTPRKFSELPNYADIPKAD
jgi:ABC-type nitrate/sulfonate/bicarbonate transport system substrate-binding protein